MTENNIVHIDTFSGIGGASIAMDAVFGKNNVTHIFCDNEPFSQAILKKHWPEAPIIGDIRAFTANADIERFVYGKSKKFPTETYHETLGQFIASAGSPFILTGGFPCQPFSQAGRRKGMDDDRHLWPEMLRVIREFKPRWVIGENVGGFVTWGEGVVLEQVCLDLEGEGYEVQPFIIPAVAVNAPHRRDRVWIVAHLIGERLERSSKQPQLQESAKNTGQAESNDANSIGKGLEGKPENEAKRQPRQPRGTRRYEGGDWEKNWLEVATELCTMDDGLPSGLARPRGWRNAALKGAGNAWVPQVAIEILEIIKHIETLT